MEIHVIVVALVSAGSGHLNCKNDLRSRRSPRECTSQLGGILISLIVVCLTDAQCYQDSGRFVVVQIALPERSSGSEIGCVDSLFF